jgi:cobalt/nickel transport system permease protein
LHHVVLERWSRGASGLHRRDPRAKFVVLGILLVTVATAGRAIPQMTAMLLALLAGALVWAGLPVAAAMARAGVVLSFTIPFALVSILAGDPARAAALLLKAYISALAVLVLVATTPLPILLRGLESARIPQFLLMVAQFLYRYLFVLFEEAQQMRSAALARGGSGFRAHTSRFRAAAGAVGALFARSYARAEDIHRAMLSRGFDGHFPTLGRLRFSATDALFTVAAAGAVALARYAAERLYA